MHSTARLGFERRSHLCTGRYADAADAELVARRLEQKRCCRPPQGDEGHSPSSYAASASEKVPYCLLGSAPILPWSRNLAGTGRKFLSWQGPVARPPVLAECCDSPYAGRLPGQGPIRFRIPHASVFLPLAARPARPSSPIIKSALRHVPGSQHSPAASCACAAANAGHSHLGPAKRGREHGSLWSSERLDRNRRLKASAARPEVGTHAHHRYCLRGAWRRRHFHTLHSGRAAHAAKRKRAPGFVDAQPRPWIGHHVVPHLPAGASAEQQESEMSQRGRDARKSCQFMESQARRVLARSYGPARALRSREATVIRPRWRQPLRPPRRRLRQPLPRAPPRSGCAGGAPGGWSSGRAGGGSLRGGRGRQDAATC